jgi:uncharacterized membrane protein HdeD (DUF308 family)
VSDEQTRVESVELAPSVEKSRERIGKTATAFGVAALIWGVVVLLAYGQQLALLGVLLGTVLIVGGLLIRR